MASAEIKRIREVVAYSDPDNPYLSLYYDEVQWPDGAMGRYNRVVEGAGHPGVAILPICDAGVGLIHVDRYPVDQRLWEIPRGFGESEDAEANARRELIEETGWVPLEIVHLGRTYPNSGLLAGHIEVFAAYINAAERGATDSEAADVRIVSLPDLRASIRAGLLPDAVTNTALVMAHCSGLLQL